MLMPITVSKKFLLLFLKKFYEEPNYNINFHINRVFGVADYKF